MTMRQSKPAPLNLKTTAPGGFRDGHHADPDREIIRALSPTTERELRRSCSAVVLGYSSPQSRRNQNQPQVQHAQVRASAVPRPLPTPAFPQKQQQHHQQQQQSWQGRVAPQAAVMAQQVPTTLAQFDFRLPNSNNTTTSDSSTHSLSSSISSTFSHVSDDVNGPSWSPCTTHHSKSSDADQYFAHALTSDNPPVPQKPSYSPSSPPPRYAFAKTATARKMSLNYQQINPRASSIITIAAQEAGQPAPPIARPTMITVPRPRTSSGVPGSPRFRNSAVPSINPDGASLRKGSDASTIAPPSQHTPVGLGFAMEFPSSKLSRSETPDTVSGPFAVTTAADAPELPPAPATPAPAVDATAAESSPSIQQGKVNRAKSAHHLNRDRTDHIRSTTSTPGIGSSASGRPFSPPSLNRRKTDMESTPSNPKKFSLFPCQVTTPVIIKDSPNLPPGFTMNHGSTSPLQSGLTSRSMSISSNGASSSARPRTSGAEKPRMSGDGPGGWGVYGDRQLPSLPGTLANASSAVSTYSNHSSHYNGGQPVQCSSQTPIPTSSPSTGKTSKKGAFKSLRKHVLAGFQSFSGSLKLGSNKHSNDNSSSHGGNTVAESVSANSGSIGRKSMSLGHRASRSLLRGGNHYKYEEHPPSPAPPLQGHAPIGCAN